MPIIKASDIQDLDKALDESLTSGNLTIETAAGNKFVAFPLKSLEGIQLNGASGVSMQAHGTVLDMDMSKLEERVLASGITLKSNNTSMELVRDNFLTKGTVTGRISAGSDHRVEIPQVPKQDPVNARLEIVKNRQATPDSMHLQYNFSDPSENPIPFLDYPPFNFPELSPEEKASMEDTFDKLRAMAMKHDIKIVFSKDVKDGE